jgi:uncharacterized membrane protein
MISTSISGMIDVRKSMSMQWLLSVSGITGVLVGLAGVSSVAGNRQAAVPLAVCGLIVMVLSSVRWVTSSMRLASRRSSLHSARR